MVKEFISHFFNFVNQKFLFNKMAASIAAEIIQHPYLNQKTW